MRHTGGVRFSETELELLALAEYVKELEAALDRQRALSSSLQQGASAKAVSGNSTTLTAFSLCFSALPMAVPPGDCLREDFVQLPCRRRHNNLGYFGEFSCATGTGRANLPTTKLNSSSNGTFGSAHKAEFLQSAPAEVSQQSEASRQRAPSTEKFEPQKAAQSLPETPIQRRAERVSWWGYITGADRATPVQSAER